MDKYKEIWNRTEWFREMRFGMFIHWGLYAIPARGEWVMYNEEITPEEYEARYFGAFTAQGFNADEWAQAAKQAGMKYIILTAKHHDGFCLFDSQHTDYKATNTPFGRDAVGEFVDAARRAGLRVGLYYSLLDWHHSQFPYVGDTFHPLRLTKGRGDEKRDMQQYLAYMHAQVKELCTQYGKIDIMWYDFSYDDLRGEAWKATELVRMVRKYQPDILLDNRLEASGSEMGSLATNAPCEYAGDYVSPEQSMPTEPPRNSDGQLLPWELCTTMNNSWGYVAADKMYKEPAMLVHNLVDAVSKGGNLLLNVGPNANGCFPRPALDILSAVGEWMAVNGESIYGCEAAGYPKPDWGRYTRKGNVVYAHLFETPMGPVPLVGIDPAQIKRVTLLQDGSELLTARNAMGAKHKLDTHFVSLGPSADYTYPLPDPVDTVLKIELNQ